MPIHTVRDHSHSDIEDIYSTRLSEHGLPKYRMPEGTSEPHAAYALVRDELLLDGNARQNLATFCTTWVEDEVKQLMTDAVDKNMIDKDEYPQTAEIESRCVHILADLWHAEKSWDTIGCSTTGSSEAAMLGGLALKWKWRARREAEGKDTSKPNIVTGPVQICWKKFARYFDVEIREVPLKGDALGLRPEDLRDYCDENTIGVVATLGVTFTGVYEPVEALARELDAIERDLGLDIPIHVDAASGGFIAPFIQRDLVWDFQLDRVRSINASGHKYGLAPLGVGWVIWASKEDLPDDLVFYVDYLGGNMPTFALNFSRPGGEIIAQYYNFLRLGREGYTQIQQACADTAQWLGEQLAEIGQFDMVYDGHGGLPAVAYKLTAGDHGFTLYDLSERVRMRGWQIASYPLPADREDTVVQRILIRHGVSRDLAALLLEDIKRELDHLEKNPVPNSTAKPGFHHG
ncbi:glutamate decarboxylase [Rhodovulum sulfidophilum]|uniref:Glutamate decarboxylase n=2 Tax=Rhodovulum sulfidophilum TaxID=35806 RepID=A0ABS1RYT8_RHOSU|nr:glutamate decarboxylase [Rhodovulum sulfidophilum]MBL3551343.1 glutamate decarboxylase [Rhodovulum sulfidophilum]MBL3597360.1 glutamate decarboxylase [Rhodovulum sulfidophilum]MBL3611256.1 glutamate decarboxylase [Rhodovulum sulfidophilum]MCE8420783.1 glutamate decarboxylase [Rhodovulum sulfidophilum]MCE8457670.1 glutamate decarboxylase [Rhodovulum sulfidophilum]